MTRNRKKLCSVEGCRAYATASGLCSGHDPEVQKRAQEAKRDWTKGSGSPYRVSYPDVLPDHLRA